MSMNLLTEGVSLHVVEPTSLSRKLTIDGITKAYPVYKNTTKRCGWEYGSKGIRRRIRGVLRGRRGAESEITGCKWKMNLI